MTQTETKLWFLEPCAEPNLTARSLAIERQDQLTKPAGSLGRFEELALQFSAWQASSQPNLERISIRVFAGDHGVCAQQVSAFPQEVTAQMIANFATGGAAINVLSEEIGADLRVVNLGTVHTPPVLDNVVNAQLSSGTADFTREPAMTPSMLQRAMDIGAEQVDPRAQLLIGGEMGIGNTTSAAALMASLLNLSPSQTVGRGTGVDDEGLQRKIKVISHGLEMHRHALIDAQSILRHLGGLEIASLVAYYIKGAQVGIPVLVDGFICTTAALLATHINPSSRQWMLFSHKSAEQGHAAALRALDAQPLVDLGLRLGEGSGAASAVPLLRLALALHNSMATFSEAGVSDG